MKFEIYLDSARCWRWRLRAANYRIVADSAESYLSERACLEGIMLVKGSGSAQVFWV